MNEFKSIVVGQHNTPTGKPAYPKQTGGRWFHSKEDFFCLPRSLRGDKRLSSLEFQVLVVLASHVYGEDSVKPSIADIKKLTGISSSAISKATTNLESYGWLKKKRRFNNSVVYQLTLPIEYRK